MSPEELAPGIYRIDGIGLAHVINILAIAGDRGWTVVDTGISGTPKRIKTALIALGVRPTAVTTVYLTHHHSDHIGGLTGMRVLAPQAEILAPEHEAEIIAGKRPFDPAANRAFRVLQGLGRPPTGRVDRTVREGEAIAGFRVIATPGHTLGHTSLLSDEHGLLLTADAFGALPRKIRVGVWKVFCADPVMAKRSAEKLLSENYSTVVFSHGPVLRDNPKERLRQIVADCDYA